MEKTKIFIAYARTDEPFLLRLREYLAPLERNQTIEVWYDGKIEAGEKWDEKIKTHLHAADLILLLVSAKSLASNYFYNEEMKDALARHEREEAIVVPVILKHCDWKETPLGKLQVIPKDAKPITSWSDESEAYYNVIQNIKVNLKNIQKRKKQAISYSQSTRKEEIKPNSVTENIAERNVKSNTKTSTKKRNRVDNTTIFLFIMVTIGIAMPFVMTYWFSNKNGNEPSVESQVIVKEKEKFNSLPASIQRLINDMVFVEGGTFKMGCTGEQQNCFDDEKPVHEVILDDFSIGKYEITQDQWQGVMGNNPSKNKGCGSRCPVEGINWNDVQEFIEKLNRMADKTFRLPIEAEWEYAARGGNLSQGFQYAGSDNINSVAWHRSNSNQETQAVGTRSPNELNLYDMSGNVGELCQDWYRSYNNANQKKSTEITGNPARVLRGGSCSNFASNCRTSFRFISAPNRRNDYNGFRVASSVD